MNPIPFLEPSFPSPSHVAADYAAIAARGVFTNGGPVEASFAHALEGWVGAGVHIALLSSCTAALELAIQALLPGGGGRVIVPSFTFAAGPLALLRLGYRPVFVDVLAATWQPDPDDAEAALVAAGPFCGVLLTNTFGVANAQISTWEEFARRHALPLIVDSAAGFGSFYPWNEPLGARGDCEVFSLHATKPLAVGEGGVLASRDLDVIDRVKRLRNFGFDSERRATMIGTNAKLTELAAAIGLRQLNVLSGRLSSRRRLQDAYIEQLAPLGIGFQPGAERSSVPFVSALLPTPALRDSLIIALGHMLVECRAYYNPPVHCQPVFDAVGPLRPLPVTSDLCARIISLPISDHLPAEAIIRVGRAAQALWSDHVA